MDGSCFADLRLLTKLINKSIPYTKLQIKEDGGPRAAAGGRPRHGQDGAGPGHRAGARAQGRRVGRVVVGGLVGLVCRCGQMWLIGLSE